jgi:polyisoprenoid-binding protein YceI
MTIVPTVTRTARRLRSFLCSSACKHRVAAGFFLATVSFSPLASAQTATPPPAQTNPAAGALAKLIPEQSSITFTSKQMGVPVDGRFGKFDAQISFDPKQAAASKISFNVDIGSAVVGDAETVREMRKPEWFNFAKFPNANFQSTSAKALGGGKFEVAGKLNIKGVERLITTTVQLSQKAGVTLVEGNFPLKRLDFKLGDGDWKDVSVVADEVIVKLKLSLTGVAAL